MSSETTGQDLRRLGVLSVACLACTTASADPAATDPVAAFAGFVYVGYENHWLGLGLCPDLMTVAPQSVAGVGFVYNDDASATVKYVTGYLVEKSLAVDDIFVIAMIFGFFA